MIVLDSYFNMKIKSKVKSIEIKPKADSRPIRRLNQKAYLNAVSSLIDFSARLLVNLVVTPILVSGLGSMFFGVWQILSRLISCISAADGRPTQALKWVTANRQASDDYASKRRDVGSALCVWLIFLPILTIVGIILIWLSPIITKVSSEQYLVVRFTCTLLVINFLLIGLIALPESVLRGMNLGYKRIGIVASITVLGGALTAGAIYLGFGLVGIAGAQIVISILTGFTFWLVVRKFVPWFGIARPKLTEVWHFLRLSSWYTVWTLVNKLLLMSDLVILGLVTSATTVTTFVLTSLPAQTSVNVISIIVGAVIPGLGGVIGKKQYDEAAGYHNEMMANSWLLVTAIGSTILLWNRSFIYLWVGAEHYAGFWANILIVLVAVQLVFIRNDAFVIDLTLNLRRKVILGAIGAFLSIGFAVVLTSYLGIIGLCLGLMGGRLILTISYPLLVSSFLGRSFRVQLISLFRPGLVTGIIFAISGYLGQQLLANNWIEWFAYTIMSFGLILCSGFIFGFTYKQRWQLTDRLKSIQLFSGNVS